MSATGRGTERRDADYYPTPAWVTERLFQHLDLPGGRWLEPSAGEGHIIRAAKKARSDVDWFAHELRTECLVCLQGLAFTDVGDFLKRKPRAKPFAVAIGNPPFSLAQEFVTHALTMADQVVFLLRLSFLESQKRETFFKRHGVPDLFVLPERPSFTGEGTDSCAYAWMRWYADGSHTGKTVILYDTRQATLPGVEL